jgi:AraC-like DNA-binding protein
MANATTVGPAGRFGRSIPSEVDAELMVTEDHGFYCGGGVHAALDLSLYLVEKFCGHEIAMQSAKALLIETPRAWQAGFAIIPLKTEHSDDSISSAQEWLHQNFHQDFPLESPARRVGMSLRNFVRRFKQATGDSPLIYLQKLRIAAAKRLLGRPPHRAGSQRRGGVSGCRLFPRTLPTPPECPPAPTGEGSGCKARAMFIDDSLARTWTESSVVAWFETYTVDEVILRGFSPEGSWAHRHFWSQNAYPLQARCFANSA